MIGLVRVTPFTTWVTSAYWLPAVSTGPVVQFPVPSTVIGPGSGTGVVQAASAHVVTVTVPGPPRPLKVAAMRGPVSAMVSGLHVIGADVSMSVFQRPSASGNTFGLTVTDRKST